jgi:hypothetical protein
VPCLEFLEVRFSRSVEKLAWTKNLISSDPLFGAWSFILT